MRLFCWICHKSVSNELPDDTVIRATAICPECIEMMNPKIVDIVFREKKDGPRNS